MARKTVRGFLVGIFLVLLFVLGGRSRPAAATEPLWFSLAPAPVVSDSDCGHGGTELPAREKPAAVVFPRPAGNGGARKPAGPFARPGGGKPASGRPAAGSGSHNGHGGGALQFESEHRPSPMRSYWLNTAGLSPLAEAYLLQPDGTVRAPFYAVDDKGLKLSYKADMQDGPMHGANNLYYVDRRVENGCLVVRTAKWLTIQHSCGWGHDHKFTPERMAAQGLSIIPLEIVVNDLWDPNFHSTVMSGDTLNVRVLHNGKPAPGAKLRLTTEKDWHKEIAVKDDGSASLQLIRDYYPGAWADFNRGTRGALRIVAEYDLRQAGEFAGQQYDSIHFISTFPWRYYPARREYSSYAVGLLLGTVSFAIGGVGIYAFRERRKKPFQEIVFDEQG